LEQKIMALARSRRSESGMNYWPGFVDALSTLILSIIFILTVFVVVQFYLQREVAGKDTALTRLNAQIAELTELLSLEKTGKSDLETELAQVRASLTSAEAERDRFKGQIQGAGAGEAAAKGRVSELAGQIEGEKKISARALAQVEVLNQQIAALRRQLTALEQTLDASEQKNKDAQSRITELGQRLNVALAQKVRELTKFRSDFFGTLRQILGNRPDVRVVGDRFVLQSELFFDTGKAEIKPEAQAELDKVADALVTLEKQIPTDIAWVLRVDGHTDVRPITGGVFKSNWDLSAARAISVVQYLAAKGVSPQRLVAAGFGEFQPIEVATTEDAYRRNRRIEFKLTER
jgi:chemotaxis protein MotB